MTYTHPLDDLNQEQLTELTRDWKEAQQTATPVEEAGEPDQRNLTDWAERHKPCPATKRNGEPCGSVRVSISGYCFAHDPESASWRAKGRHTRSKKARVSKRLKEAGLDEMVSGLQEVFEELRVSSPTPTNARAMARIADTIIKMTEWASKNEDKHKSTTYTGWIPYE